MRRRFGAYEKTILEAELGTEDAMAQVKGDDEAYEDRLVILEDLGIEENALEHDESTDEVSASTDEAAVRRFFARAFQEWANGNVEGTAEEIFDAVVTLLDSDD
jgi:hypothetical protein